MDPKLMNIGIQKIMLKVAYWNITKNSIIEVSNYTMLHIFRQVLFWDVDQRNPQDFNPSFILSFWLIFTGMKQKKARLKSKKTLLILNIFPQKF